MNSLEIKHLRMVNAIAATGNMTKAAQKLFITQPALSQQLKNIEHKLGVDLFFRVRKKMVLTPIGKKLLAPAQNIIETIEDIELDISKTVSGDKGRFKVGTQCIYCYKWLPGVMHEFKTKFPNVELEMGSSADPVQDLESCSYDLIITVRQVKDDNFSCLPLFEDQLICIMQKDHPLSAGSYIDLKDFSESKLISHATRKNNRFYQQVLKPEGIEPKGIMTIEQPLAIIEMVSAGFGISVFPRWAIEGSSKPDGIALRPITKHGFPLVWYAAMLKNDQIPVFQKEFLKIVSNTNQ